ncbi:MAG: GNAT family N-acetyltransferase [Chloroflexota bacterium]
MKTKPKAIIRPYESFDREAVFKVAADTAFFGEAVEEFIEDRALFCDSFCAYYTDLAYDMCWVAEADQMVVGYLLGCTQTRLMWAGFREKILPRLIRNFVMKKYHLGHLTWTYLKSIARANFFHETTAVDDKLYPAHLHVNLDRAYRGMGIGRELIEAFLSQLRERGVAGVHLKTTSENVAACALYEKMGFQLLDSRRTKMWRPWLGRDIENRCYGMLLG